MTDLYQSGLDVPSMYSWKKKKPLQGKIFWALYEIVSKVECIILDKTSQTKREWEIWINGPLQVIEKVSYEEDYITHILKPYHRISW